MSDRAGGPSLDEGDLGRRRRRRRRRRGGERPFGENSSQDAPQPTDDGLAVVAEIGGDLQAPSGEVSAFDRRGPRSEEDRDRRSRRSRGQRDRFSRRSDGESTRETGAPSFELASVARARRGIRRIRSRLFPNAAAFRRGGFRSRSDRRASASPRPMKPASNRRRLPMLRSLRSRGRRPSWAQRQPLSHLRLQRPTPLPSRRQRPLLRQRTSRRGLAAAAGGSGLARA